MTTQNEMVGLDRAVPMPGGAVSLSRRVPLSAVRALLRITAERQLRGRKLFVLCLLFSLPVLFAVLARRYQVPYFAADTEIALVFGLIPQAFLPLAALIFASGMVQDDVEEQTITYLLIRPIPRWLIYLVKLAGTWLVIALLASFFTAAALAVVYGGTGELTAAAVAQRAVVFAGILALSLFSYTGIFGAWACSCAGRCFWASPTFWFSKESQPTSTSSFAA